MNTKATIHKILFIAFWVCIGAGMLTLLIAAIGKKEKELCRDFSITVKSVHQNYFIDEKDITGLLQAAMGTAIRGRKINEINLDQLEQLLKDNIWISNAEMWFDNRNILMISVTERDPVARIFTTEGNSFYIDSSLVILPLSEKISARVPVFTSFPDREMITAKDSLLLQDIRNTAIYISADPFLTSQVAQIDIVNNEKFEMVPVVGNHLVKLGDGTDIDKKFNRLKIFYQQVLSKSGFNTYSIIDVQYAGQVTGTKRGREKNTVDMARLKVNVEKLLSKVQKLRDDPSIEEKPVIEKPIIKEDQQDDSKDNLKNTAKPSADPNAVKTTSLPGEKENKSDENKPKAVMPKKKENNENKK